MAGQGELPPYEGVAPVDVHIIWNPQAGLNRAERSALDFLLRRIRERPPDERLPAD